MMNVNEHTSKGSAHYVLTHRVHYLVNSHIVRPTDRCWKYNAGSFANRH
jgi:hypothetical protein